MSNSYKTLAGENGDKLSGEQRQRIAIARAILKNAPIVIFDEATSQLDFLNENIIQQTLWNHLKSKTTIYYSTPYVYFTKNGSHISG